MKPTIALVVTLAMLPSFAFYLRRVLQGIVKPHAITWLIWSVVNAVAAGAQISAGDGIGGVFSTSVAITTFAIFVVACRRGERNVTTFDWLCLGVASLAGLLLLVVDQSLPAVMLIVTVDAMAMLPTVRKSYNKPHEESVVPFVNSAFTFGGSLLAFDHFSLETILFPTFVAISDSALATMILLRRSRDARTPRVEASL